MKTIKLKSIISIHKLEKPYSIGTMAGFIMGFGVAKILNNVYLHYFSGVLSGLVIFIIGIIVWIRQYREERLN
jgi:hypothetical protein